MAEFTLFEVHLDGAEFTVNAPFSSADGEDAAVDDRDGLGADGDRAGGGLGVGGVVVALLALVVLAVVVRKVLGDDAG